MGLAKGGKLAGHIRGLPVGGPYDIDVRIGTDGECVAVRDVLVGDLWVLAGQSNMEGIGWLKDKRRPVPMVRAFYMTDEWDVAVDPLHTLWCAVDPVHGGNPKAPRVQPARWTGVGPGVAFGQELHRRTGVPQGLIACGHGGTSMSQWDPGLKKLGGQSLYGAMCRRVAKNGECVAGVLWYQGCSDASPEAAPCYSQRMDGLVRSMRRDLADARLPIVAVQISRYSRRGAGAEWWDSIREQQRRLGERIDRLAVVPAIDLPMDDLIHISGTGQNELGRRCAEAMLVLREGRKAGMPPIEVRDVTVRPNPTTGAADVVVRFRNVTGSLRSPGRPTGFSAECHATPLSPFRVDLEGDRAVLRMSCQVSEADGAVYYGQGLDPYCNIVDEANRSIPAFGPLPMRASKPRAVTPYINHLRVSEVLPGVSIRKLGCPDTAALKLKPRRFEGGFCDRHRELEKAGEALVYYAAEFRCARPMKLKALLGYDGPVKVWVDGKAVFCDPAGTNPARPEDAVIPFPVKEGTHEILVALGSHGAAWGIFLRLERADVSTSQLRKNPQGMQMPEILG